MTEANEGLTDVASDTDHDGFATLASDQEDEDEDEVRQVVPFTALILVTVGVSVALWRRRRR